MNCQEFSRLIGNTHNISVAGQSEAMEAHLRQCGACRMEWESWREIAALEIPATPDGLGDRILEALSPKQQRPRRNFRPFLSSPEALWAEARTKVLDTNLPEHERVRALWSFDQYRRMDANLAGRALDSEVIVAAATLATTSADAQVREPIWVPGVGARQALR